MLTIGVDSHKNSLTAVAIDALGCELGVQCVPNSPAGRTQLLDWARALSPTERQWGVEGSGMYGRLLAQHLAREGEDV